MWAMTSEPIKEDGVVVRIMSYSSTLNREEPDNIISFNSMEDAIEFDIDEFLKDFDWKTYKDNYKTKEEKELERGLKQELERGENIQ